MPAAYEADNEYTDEQLLALYREALARVVKSGQSYQIAGRMLTMANLPEIREMIQWLEGRISAASGSGGSKTNFAKFRRR